MERLQIAPRPDWQQIVEGQGFNFHTIDGKPYWSEDVFYHLTASEIDTIEAATAELWSICWDHCAEVVRAGDYLGYNFTNEQRELISKSWSMGHQHMVARFDLGFKHENTGRDGPTLKMFEINADTPTALPEASIWQWAWKEDQIRLGKLFPDTDQFNSIHEKLVELTKSQFFPNHKSLHLVAHGEAPDEDWGNLGYLADVAAEAGFTYIPILPIENMGGQEDGQFIDANGRPINLCFKLYPWEWMAEEENFPCIIRSKTQFIEPPWKMLLSTKAVLPMLWERNPGHPNLLESLFEPIRNETWVRKPIYGREGWNISRVKRLFDMQGVEPAKFSQDYNQHGYVIQKHFDSVRFGDYTPVIGSWVIGNEPAGIGIREDCGITTNESRFVPHVFR